MAGRRPWRRLLPLVLATTATQASIVVLAPLVVEIGRDLGRVGQRGRRSRARCWRARRWRCRWRSGPLIDRIGVRPLIVRGAALALAGAGLTAAAPSLPLFYAAHAVTGAGVACLLSAGFAGVASSFDRRRGALGDGLRGGRAVAGLDRGQPDHRPAGRRGLVAALLRGARGRSALAALAAGLTAPRGRGRWRPRARPSVRDGPGGRVPRPVGAALDHRRAGGLLGVDRRADLRGRVLRRRTTACPRPRWACCWRSARWCSWSPRSTRAAHAPLPRRPLIVAAALGMGVMLIPVLNVTPSVLVTLGVLLRAGGVRRRALDRVERARPRAAARPRPGA